MRALLAIAVVSSLAAHARAQAPAEQSKADTIFEEAQALKQAGKTAEACQKYDEALSYNQNAVGTLLNVGKCNEDAGRIATAIKHYTQARDLAREHNLTEHRTAAEARIAAISERVPRLTIAFAERPDGMKLVIDDVVFPTDRPDQTNEIRLDPGRRHIVVTAPDRLPFDTYVALEEGKPHTVPIPTLGHPVTVRRTRATAGKVLTVAGAGLVVAGLAMGWVANRDYEEQVGPFGSGAACEIPMGGGEPLCDAEGYGKTGRAYDLARYGTYVGITGVAVLAGGLVLWLVLGEKAVEQQQVTVVPSIGAESAGLTAVGRF